MSVFLSCSRLAWPHSLRLEEEFVRIGAVDRRVAERTRLIFLRQVVERGSRGRAASIHAEGMAFETEQVHLRTFQQPRIGGAVWYMARNTAFNFHRLVLENEWTLLVGVALETDQILRCRGAQLASLKTPVRIVAVAALHHSFVHSVMEGAGELLLGLQMAAVAEARLLLLHQELAFLGVMRIVAICAADIVLQMR